MKLSDFVLSRKSTVPLPIFEQVLAHCKRNEHNGNLTRQLYELREMYVRRPSPDGVRLVREIMGFLMSPDYWWISEWKERKPPTNVHGLESYIWARKGEESMQNYYGQAIRRSDPV